MKFFYVYVLYNKIKNFIYIGYSEKFETLIEARRREAEIKGWRRKKKLNLIKFGKRII